MSKRQMQNRIQNLERKQHQLQQDLRWERSKNKRLIQEIKAAEARVDYIQTISEHRKIPMIRPKSRAKKRVACACALATDWHVEEKVDPKTITYLNEYNLEIARKRAEKFFRGFVFNIQSRSQDFIIKDALLWIGGDIITGYIHEELVESNYLSPTEAAMFAMDLFFAGINYILDNTDVKLTVPCSFGNHGRIAQKKKVSTAAANSYEYLMYHMLARMFKGNRRVKFVIADGSLLYLDVYGYLVRFHHGDDIEYRGGVNGLAVPMGKKIAKWDRARKADLTCVGHFHQIGFYGMSAVCNGSLIGYNAYAQKIGASPEDPMQAFFLIDKERGLCNMTKIWVTESKSAMT